MKKTRGLAYLLGILLFGLAGGSLVQAAEIEITADFRPAVTDKNHNTFRNTTTLDKKAICIQWPHFCHNKEAFSIALPFAPIQQRKTLLVGDASRQGVYFKWPSKARKIEVIKVNQSGNQSKTVTFRVAAFGATLKGITRNIYDWYSVSGNTRFHMPEPPCGYMRIAVGYHEFITFLWETTLSDDVCVRRSLDERPAGSHYFEDFGIMYELKTPDPLAMGSGIYEGEKNFYIGEGQDIDFGDNFKTEETVLTIKFILTVHHDLKVTPEFGAEKVILVPQDGSQRGWDRYLSGASKPTKLTGRSKFRLSSSGEFTVYLKCDKDFSQQDGECALTSEKSSRTVPVRAFLTLASNTVVKDSQKSVTSQPLRTTKDLNHNIFRSNHSGNNYPGHIDFEVSGKQHIDTLLTDPPDTYKGNVTIVFDANVHT